MSFVRNYLDTHPIHLLGEKSSGLGKKQNIQDFYTIRKECLVSGKLFEDPAFPASDSSLSFSKKSAAGIEWRRPKEMSKDPQFFSGGFSCLDIQQGELGDSWLLAAVANLTQDMKLFLRVVCDDNKFDENYAGIFHFRFWQYGKWVDVVVDDRLPTRGGNFVYLHSKEKNEFWSALLEKAYAKLHGSYEALEGGKLTEALTDFTGGVTESYDLKRVTPNFFRLLEKGFERHSMMGVSMTSDPKVVEAAAEKGLIGGHAYSITSVKTFEVMSPSKRIVQLLRIRNPWGSEAEWKGSWSDKSQEWQLVSDQLRNEIGLTLEKDGEFWMNYSDFLMYFDDVDICNITPDSLVEERTICERKRWNTKVLEGEWVFGMSAGGCINNKTSFHRNPQYIIKVETPDEGDKRGECTVVVALMQKNRKSEFNKKNVSIGFEIYPVAAKDRDSKPQKMDFFRNAGAAARGPAFTSAREVSHRFKLPPGRYLILPSTFKINEEAEFLIRVFSEGPHVFEEHDQTIGLGENDKNSAEEAAKETSELAEAEELFKKVAGSEQEVGWEKLKKLLDQLLRDVFDAPPAAPTNGHQLEEKRPSAGELGVFEGLSKDLCRTMLAMLDADHTGKLGLKEFKTLMRDVVRWKNIYKKFDRDHKNKMDCHDLRDAFASSGYKLNTRVLNRLVQRYGSSNKTLAFDDFLLSAVKVKTLIDHFKTKDINNCNQATLSIEEWIRTGIYT